MITLCFLYLRNSIDILVFDLVMCIFIIYTQTWLFVFKNIVAALHGDLDSFLVFPTFASILFFHWLVVVAV